MSPNQAFCLMAGVYVAPHMSAEVALPLAAVFLALVLINILMDRWTQ